MNRILLLEDDPVMARYYFNLLEKEFDLDTASTVEEATERIMNQGPYAVILSDLVLEEGDSLPFLSQIDSINPGIIKIILTGYPSLDKALEAGKKCDVFRFLEKGIPPWALKSVIVEAIAKKMECEGKSQYDQVLTKDEISFLTEPIASLATDVDWVQERGKRTKAKPAKVRQIPEFSKMIAQAQRSNIGMGMLTISFEFSANKEDPSYSLVLSNKIQRALQDRLRETDSIYRPKMTSFDLLLWEITSSEDLESIAKEIWRLCKDELLLANCSEDQCIMKIGGGLFPLHGNDLQSLFSHAKDSTITLGFDTKLDAISLFQGEPQES